MASTGAFLHLIPSDRIARFLMRDDLAATDQRLLFDRCDGAGLSSLVVITRSITRQIRLSAPRFPKHRVK
jgi:hypothetical protein